MTDQPTDDKILLDATATVRALAMDGELADVREIPEHDARTIVREVVDLLRTAGRYTDPTSEKTTAPAPAGELREALTVALLAICDPAVQCAYESATGEVEALLAWPPGALSRDATKADPHTIGDIMDAVAPVMAAREAEAENRGAARALRDLTEHLLRERDRLRPIRRTPGHSWMRGMEDAAREAHVRATRVEDAVHATIVEQLRAGTR